MAPAVLLLLIGCQGGGTEKPVPVETSETGPVPDTTVHDTVIDDTTGDTPTDTVDSQGGDDTSPDDTGQELFRPPRRGSSCSSATAWAFSTSRAAVCTSTEPRARWRWRACPTRGGYRTASRRRLQPRGRHR